MASDTPERDLVRVLSALTDGTPNCVSDILFGFQRYPMSGSENDARVRDVEESLIKRGFVTVTEPRGTNKTHNGYAYFVISPQGKRYLKDHERSTRPKFAITNNQFDDNLEAEGLSNWGLLGYVDNEKDNDTYPLRQFKVTFPRGEAYFYTLDVSNEKFQTIAPIDLGTLGYARKDPKVGYHKLYRFFHFKDQYHVFITNPNLSELPPDKFKDESQDNPIYIRSSSGENGTPIFLYSNSPTIYSTTLPFTEDDDSDSDSGDETPSDFFKRALTVALVTRGFMLSDFVMISEGNTDITVSVRDALHNFYINQQDNNVYTVRRNPPPDGEAVIMKDLTDWNFVFDLFVHWAKGIRSRDLYSDKAVQPPSLVSERNSDNSAEVPSVIVYDNHSIYIGDSTDVEAALNVDAIAQEITTIIRNLKPDTGNMIGIFAPWGRGKTRLMKEIWKLLSDEEANAWARLKKKIRMLLPWGKKPVKYYQIKYQAWRYQDTPAAWAYLYEQFSLAFLGNNRKLQNIPRYHFHLLRLNIERHGWWGFLGFAAFLFLATMGVLVWTPLKEEIVEISSRIWISIAGVLVGISFKNFRLGYFTKAINIINKYGIKVSFRNTLGVQAEIQKELVHIINAWAPNGAKKKLLLVVDDLDRCNEEKTIEIIDALRIILDDDDLKDKLFVLTAIDERILSSAVGRKYHDVKDVKLDELSREYIDKLFIFSIKLGCLTESETMDFFEKFIRREKLTWIKEEVSEPSKTQSANNDIRTEANIKNAPPINQQQTAFAATQGTENKKKPNPTIKNPSDKELHFIEKNLSKVENITPRKIRILYYRYLFARNLIITSSDQRSTEDYWLNESHQEHFVEFLIHFSESPTRNITREMDRIKDLTGEGTPHLSL
ncbi:KAP family NTPase [Fulvivirgaceae bacterium PWU5]|uniref:KAP family NTPase n=1 Tax=Dawidia cretensis TaxID=2782350 RepID=A0AAP2E4A6_9BACT|nr:P-loop NTPase fold protein [Dawidia cretensis]MBT1711939.1 KAP family NTPase [Dawidia cretensis]